MVSRVFLRPDPPSHTVLLPSLRRLYPDYFTLRDDNDWRPLITIKHLGGQPISLRIGELPDPVPPEANKLEGLAEEFDVGFPSDW